MSNEKVIAVVGATGAQGGGLARAILNDREGQFALRAITRNPDSAQARKLVDAGAEVVRADADDEASLTKAFDGAYGAFLVTNFWEHFSPERELAQAGNMARAAKAAGLRHVVWSTLEDSRKWVPLEDDRMPTLQDKYKVPHFDAKGEADGFFRELGVPTTFLLTSFYWENFIHFGAGPKPGPDGTLALTLPMGNAKLPSIGVEDIGKCAYGILRENGQYTGKTVGIAAEHLTGAEMADALSEALGKKVVYNDVPPEVYRGFGFPGADDLGNMFQFNRDFSQYFCGVRDIEFARRMNPDLQSLKEWLGVHCSEIPLE